MLSISSQRTNMKKKAVKMLVLVVVLYLVCWSPLQVFSLLMRESDNIKASQVVGLKYYLECLAFSGTAYNPIVYAFLNQSFRNNFRAVLLRKWRRIAPLSIARGDLALERADAFKTGSSNFDAGNGTQTRLETGNNHVARRTKMTII
ncbi:pyroglutamylated RFamide peptide receptor [Elysia marginata]|uniref:Pyroglutamylated RFamide peptide receptor n=1 Tax=Elysia marginata TaxID=1093978 RepID=A0AAV4GBI6_9GAST|nr:pyroglutamylated RFamide peptide receptor [Elysia marginata]